MKEYEIIPIKTGIFTSAEKSNFSYQKDPGTKIIAPVICYLVIGKDFNMMVDTGNPDEEWSAKYHHPLIQTEDMKPENAIKKYGVEPEDIDIIVNTHLHWDHCSNNDKFPNAKIYVQKKEIQFAISPLPTQYVYYESHQINMTPKFIKDMNRFEVIDGDYDLADGIKLLFTPGHTPGFQSILVNTAEGKYIIASDTVGLLENWYENLTGGLPTPSGIHINLESYYDSIQKLLSYDAKILPGHDEAVFKYEKYPNF